MLLHKINWSFVIIKKTNEIFMLYLGLIACVKFKVKIAVYFVTNVLSVTGGCWVK